VGGAWPPENFCQVCPILDNNPSRVTVNLNRNGDRVIQLQPRYDDTEKPEALGGTYPKKILVIDGDPLIRQGLSLFLREEGYEVDEARDGDEAGSAR
jgi:PleD family two-component response regulator